jgi:hypothetical protein
LQVPHLVDTEMSQEKAVLGIAARARASTARTGYAQRRRDTGGAIAASPYAHTDLHSAVGIEEAVIREYIRQQENKDRRIDQLSLWE